MPCRSDLAATLGWGWLIFLAPNVQAVYDMNFIALRCAEAVNLPAATSTGTGGGR